MSKRSPTPRKKPEEGWQTYEQKKDALLKYQKSRAHIGLSLSPEQKSRWQAAAEKAGESMTEFLSNAAEERIKKMEKDNG